MMLDQESRSVTDRGGGNYWKVEGVTLLNSSNYLLQQLNSYGES